MALLSKLAWKTFNCSPNLWSSILINKYGCGASTQLSGNNLKENKNSSGTWKSIIKDRKICKRDSHWNLGSRDKISFWHDNWIPNCGILTHTIYSPLSLKDHKISVRDVMQNGVWKLDEIEYDLPVEITNQILSMIISFRDNYTNKLVWGQTHNGTFTTKSVYD